MTVEIIPARGGGGGHGGGGHASGGHAEGGGAHGSATEEGTTTHTGTTAIVGHVGSGGDSSNWSFTDTWILVGIIAFFVVVLWAVVHHENRR